MPWSKVCFFECALYPTGLHEYLAELRSTTQPNSGEEKQYLERRDGGLYFTIYDADIKLRDSKIQAHNASVFIEEENR